MMARKSVWTDCFIEDDRSKKNILSWFSPLADDMKPYKAEILCDIETDAEKKIRMFATTPDGQRYQLVRARTSKGFTLSMKRLPPAAINGDE